MELIIEQISIDILIPYARNTRTHTKEQIIQIASSIKEFGFTNPVLIDNDNGIIAGHGRVLAAAKLNINELPCIRLGYLTKAQKKAYIIADNKLALNAGWDDELLKLELEELKNELDFDIDVIGFSDKELNSIFKEEIEEDDFDGEKALNEIVEPITKRGDVWQLGRHRLLCGDSTAVTDIDILMNGMKADMVHTDPPYNVDYSNANRPKPSKKDLGKIKNDVMDVDVFQQFLKDIAGSIDIATKEECGIYVWYASNSTIAFYSMFEGTNIAINQQIVWKKPMLLGRGNYQWAHEPCIYAKKGSAYFTGDRTKTTIWDFGGYDKSKNVHPTQKPLFLPTEAINNSSKKGDIVLDLFGGSGSTLIAAEQLSRSAYVMELDEKYCDVIIKRYEEYTGNKAELIKEVE